MFGQGTVKRRGGRWEGGVSAFVFISVFCLLFFNYLDGEERENKFPVAVASR